MSKEIAIAIKKDNKLIDLQTASELNIKGENIFFENSADALAIIRHSTAHLMAQAIKKIFPEALFFVGPVVKNGFYYDFKIKSEIGLSDLKHIEKEMINISKKKINITKYSITKEEAKVKFANDYLKLTVLQNIPSNEVSIYKQDDFEDLCRGPHLLNTSLLRFFKLTKIAGAYLGGNSKNEMLTRIYGTAFADKESLKNHIIMLEQAAKRDHRKLGNELKLFTFREEIGAGFPIWLPAGARLRARLESLLFKAHRKRGYEPVRGPEILKSDLWKTSGHYENFGEHMYFTNVDDTEFGLKPMNCVGHIEVYKDELHSYKDFPIKYFEYGVVHRHEMTGALHGLFRVREFTQDDAHIFCTTNQLQEQITEIIDLVDKVMKTFDFDYKMVLSTKPSKAIGSDDIWEKAETALKKAMTENNFSYEIDNGGGAFYGPKIDINITDAIGREWQCSTIQLDFNLPQRFKLEYNTCDNTKIEPVMIHRVILGSFERFIGILTEHYAGEFPMFIAPTQVAIIPIAQTHHPYAKEIADILLDIDANSIIYDKNDSLNKRVRTAEKQKVPMLVILGDKEVKDRSVSIRDRRDRNQYDMKLDKFLIMIKDKMNEVKF